MNVLSILNVLHIFNDGFQASFVLLLPFIAREFHLNLTQSGILAATINVLAVLLALPAGYLSSRFGGLRLLIIGAIFSTIGFFGIAFGSSFIWLIPLFFIAGTGFAIFHPIAFAMIAGISKKGDHGKVVGGFTAIGDIGRVGLTALITYFIVHLGWRNTSIFYGVIGLIVFTVYSRLLWVTSLPRRMDRKISGAIAETRLRHLIVQRKFLFAHIAGILDAFASVSMFVFIPFFLLSKGTRVEILGTMTAMFFVGNIIGKYLMGKYSDRYSNTVVFIVADLLMAVVIYLFATTNSFYLYGVYSIILGALTKGTVPVFQTMVAESLEKERYLEKAYGLSSLLMSTMNVVAPIVLGYISDLFGITSAFYLCAGFALLATVPAYFFGIERRSNSL